MEESLSDIFIEYPECTFFTLNASLEKDPEKLPQPCVLEYSGNIIGNSFIHSSSQKIFYTLTSDIILEVGDKAVNRTEQASALMELTI